MTSKSGKLYLHTDIRLIVSRKADLDTAAAHSAMLRPAAPLRPAPPPSPTTPQDKRDTADRSPIRVFGGSSEHDSETSRQIEYSNKHNLEHSEIGYSNGNNSELSPEIKYSNKHELEPSLEIGYDTNVSYELRSFTFAPDNPKYSPR